MRVEKTFREVDGASIWDLFSSALILDLEAYCRLMTIKKLKTLSSVRLYCFCLLILACTSLVLGAQDLTRGEEPETIFSEARRTMIERDIARRAIKEPRLVRVVGSRPRHPFLPEDMRPYAYPHRSRL